MQSPRIKRLAWGRVEVEGKGSLKDAKLFPGGSREWNWDETGTSHEQGIQPDDIAELLDNGAEVVVLSKGITGRLEVNPKTLALLHDKHIPVHVLQSEEAVKVYNRLREVAKVGGLIHSTC